MSDERIKRPAFQWYPGDFRRDTALQACCFEARALWREMLDLMHDGEPYGHLTGGGVVITPAELARMVGKTLREVAAWMGELEARKVFSRTADGVIYSRRMVRDESLRTRRAAGGKLGGNPELLKKKDASKVNLPPNVHQTPAVATAVASAVALELVPPREPPTVEPRIRFCVAANKGLAEHPDRPQLIPLVMPNAGNTYQATEELMGLGAPIEFIEQVIYVTALGHNAPDKVNSLNYFVNSVKRHWADSEMTKAVRSSTLQPGFTTSRRATQGGARNDAAINSWLQKKEAAEAANNGGNNGH